MLILCIQHDIIIITCQKEEKECIQVFFLIYAVLSQFKFCCIYAFFCCWPNLYSKLTKKSFFPKSGGDMEVIVLASCFHFLQQRPRMAGAESLCPKLVNSSNSGGFHAILNGSISCTLLNGNKFHFRCIVSCAKAMMKLSNIKIVQK